MTAATDGPLFKRLFPGPGQARIYVFEGRWSSLPPLKACCQRVVDTYLMLFNPPRENANLYCPECHASILYRAGAWVGHT